MAFGYMAHDNVETRLNTVQLELVAYYMFNPHTRFNGLMTSAAVVKNYADANAELLDLSMLHLSDRVTPEDHANDRSTYCLSARGSEHMKRVLAMPLPVGRVVWTLPEEGE